MAKGTVLTKNKEGDKVGRYEDDHPAVELAEYITDNGGEIAPRAMGFKMTDKDGGRLGFCVPNQEGYRVYLTTINHDDDFLSDLNVEVSKGSSGLAVVKDLGNAKKAVKVLRDIYAAKPEDEPKPKKAKADKADKPKKTKKAKAKDDDTEEEAPRRKKRRRKNKAASDDE